MSITIGTLWTIFKAIGSVVGIIITLITFWGIISKKPLEAFKRSIRTECDKSNEPLKEQITNQTQAINTKFSQMEQRLGSAEQTDLAILRNTITHIYFKYKDDKKIPHFEKENVLSLYENYERLGGNSYTHDLVNKIKEWDEII